MKYFDFSDMKNIDMSCGLSQHGVTVYVNAFGEYTVPKNVVLDAMMANDCKGNIFDKRTRGYKKILKPWMSETDKKSEEEWSNAK